MSKMSYLAPKMFIGSCAVGLFSLSGAVCASSLEVSLEAADDGPAVFEDSKIKVFIKNTGADPLDLPDRFSGKNQIESLLVQITDEDDKPVAASHYMRYSFPREEKNITLNPEKRIVVPVTFGKVFYDPRLPVRYVMKKIEEDRDYKITVTYTWFSEKEGVIKQRVKSEPITMRFKARNIPSYMENNTLLLSEPKNLQEEETDHKDEAARLGMDIALEHDSLTAENDGVTITFENKWDDPVTLWKPKPGKDDSPRDCCLSFILCRKDGTPVADIRPSVSGNYDPAHNSRIESGRSFAVSVKLSDYLPESVFARPGEYYLVARYHNTMGSKCLQGTWYSRPCPISIAAAK